MGVPYISESDIFDAGVKLGLDPNLAGNGIATYIQVVGIEGARRVYGKPWSEWLYEGMTADELKEFVISEGLG
jgi:hypothetical protein